VYSDGSICFHAESLAEWWRLHRRGQVEARTQSGGALQQQADALGQEHLRGSVRLRAGGRGTSQVRYRRLNTDISAVILRRSQGESDGHGVHLDPTPEMALWGTDDDL
ncbi:MAG: hypothetical protein M3Q75_02030, partial [Gemmatimonadota bacterium]|nr:hypothetical protein [Gemmatimonadota bacterium]